MVFSLMIQSVLSSIARPGTPGLLYVMSLASLANKAPTIEDPNGKEFWIEHFGPGKSVAWDVFLDYLKVT